MDLAFAQKPDVEESLVGKAVHRVKVTCARNYPSGLRGRRFPETKYIQLSYEEEKFQEVQKVSNCECWLGQWESASLLVQLLATV